MAEVKATTIKGELVHPLSRAEWRRWLEDNHTRREGVWLVTYKRATGKPRVEYEEAIEEALCFGWVDAQARTLDEERSLLWFAPRKKGSVWATTNKERVERLPAAGKMTAAGLAKIEAAKADGSWALLDSVDQLIVPPDLAAAPAAAPPAAANFDAFPRSVKHRILGWIALAKRPQTRAARVQETARLAAAGKRVGE